MRRYGRPYWYFSVGNLVILLQATSVHGRDVLKGVRRRREEVLLHRLQRRLRERRRLLGPRRGRHHRPTQHLLQAQLPAEESGVSRDVRWEDVTMED